MSRSKHKKPKAPTIAIAALFVAIASVGVLCGYYGIAALDHAWHVLFFAAGGIALTRQPNSN